MLYRVEVESGRCYRFATGRKELLALLQILKGETILDIRRVYKSGATESVFEIYRKFINRTERG